MDFETKEFEEWFSEKTPYDTPILVLSGLLESEINKALTEIAQRKIIYTESSSDHRSSYKVCKHSAEKTRIDQLDAAIELSDHNKCDFFILGVLTEPIGYKILEYLSNSLDSYLIIITDSVNFIPSDFLIDYCTLIEF